MVIRQFQSIVFLRAFDVELLYIAQELGMPIKEVPVNWQEIDGLSHKTCLCIVSLSLCSIPHQAPSWSHSGVGYKWAGISSSLDYGTSLVYGHCTLLPR